MNNFTQSVPTHWPSLAHFKLPLLEQDIQEEVASFKKTLLKQAAEYFKVVTVLPQLAVGIYHFIDTGGFSEFYEDTFDLDIVVVGFLGEGAALMYEIYQAVYHRPRTDQIANYSITTFIFFVYGIHKRLPIFLWKQNWLFLMIPVACLMRAKLIRGDAIHRTMGLALTIFLFGIISFRLYSIYRAIDLIRWHYEPLTCVLCLEAAVEIFWLYRFVFSIQKSFQDREVRDIVFPCCRKSDYWDSSADLIGQQVVEASCLDIKAASEKPCVMLVNKSEDTVNFKRDEFMVECGPQSAITVDWEKLVGGYVRAGGEWKPIHLRADSCFVWDGVEGQNVKVLSDEVRKKLRK